MNRLSRFHDALAIISIGAPLTGLFIGNGPNAIQQYILCVFMMLLRLKLWIDDIDYFEGRSGDRTDFVFQLGLGLGVLSWVMLTIAGLSVLETQRAGMFLFGGFVLSTLWLLLEIFLGGRSYKDQIGFIFYNLLYLTGFAGIWMFADGFWMWSGLLLAVFTLVVDLATSNVFARLVEKDPPRT